MMMMVGWVEQTRRRQWLVRWLQVGHVPMVVGEGEVVVIIQLWREGTGRSENRVERNM